MGDFAFYWQQYGREAGRDGLRVLGWYTSRAWVMTRLVRGDRVWLFIAGEACGQTQAAHQAYLAELLVVAEVVNNPEYRPNIEGSPRFRIVGIEDRCALVTPRPILVDDIFRRPGSNPLQHIGVARQTPFQLDEGQVAALLGRLHEKCPEVHALATQV